MALSGAHMLCYAQLNTIIPWLVDQTRTRTLMQSYVWCPASGKVSAVCRGWITKETSPGAIKSSVQACGAARKKLILEARKSNVGPGCWVYITSRSPLLSLLRPKKNFLARSTSCFTALAVTWTFCPEQHALVWCVQSIRVNATVGIGSLLRSRTCYLQ